MLRRVETVSLRGRRSLTFARLSPLTHPYVTAAGKVTVTQEAMKVVDEAFQLFGGARRRRASTRSSGCTVTRVSR